VKEKTGMTALQTLGQGFAEHWQIWLVSTALVAAAVIDGWKLKVPNWLTFPMILSGWAYGLLAGGWAGLGYSVLGTFAGLGLLLPLYAIGGMGAGDVKLLAGVGAWVGTTITFYAFCWSAVAGGLIALAMVLYRRTWAKHRDNFVLIVQEVLTVGTPSELAARAAERKSRMLLLPYGIPLAIGSIGYFAWTGMLL
jgi:prepilin peptidase CpaA